MQTRSLRFRLTIWYTAVLTAGLALFGTLLWLSLRHELTADLERDLDGRAARFESFFRSESAEAGVHVSEELEEFCQALPPGSYINVHGSRGFSFHYPAGSPVQPGLRVLERKFIVNGETFDLEVGAPLTDITRFLNLLRLLLWSLIPVVIALGCIGGAWLSGRALKPVQDVTNAALAISIENLSGRLPVPGTSDEIASPSGSLCSSTPTKTSVPTAAFTSNPLATATPSTNVCSSRPRSALTLTLRVTTCVSSPKWKCPPNVCWLRCTRRYETSIVIAAACPPRPIASGTRSTNVTDSRKPAANASMRSRACTLHRLPEVTARAPTTFAAAAETP